MEHGTPLLNSLKFEPEERWLAGALLVSPRIATLTGDEWPRFGSRLSHAGLWEPVHLDRMGPHDLELAVDQTIQTFEDYQSKAKSLSRDMQAPGRTWLKTSKVGRVMADRLVETGYVSKQPTGHQLEGDATFIDTLLYLAGRNLASHLSWNFDVSSSAEATVALAPFTSHSGGTPTDVEHDEEPSALVGMGNCMPTLAPGVGLEEVIAFREKEKDSFAAFQVGLNRMVAATADPDKAPDELKSYHDVLSDFTKAAHSFGVRLRMETRYLALPAKNWMKLWGTDKRLKAKIMTAAGATLATYNLAGDLETIVNPDIMSGTALALGITLAAAKMRQDSPLAYLSKAAKSGIILAKTA